MKKSSIIFSCLLMAVFAQAQNITFQSELSQLSDLSSLPAYRTGTVWNNKAPVTAAGEMTMVQTNNSINQTLKI